MGEQESHVQRESAAREAAMRVRELRAEAIVESSMERVNYDAQEVASLSQRLAMFENNCCQKF